MGRTTESEKIRKEFLENFEVSVKRNGYGFIGPIAPHKEIYLIAKPNSLFAVFVKVSAIKEKFWGLNEKLQNDFREIFDKKKDPGSVQERIVILLDGAKRGYFLTGDKFDELSKSLYSDKNGDYKILEKDLNTMGTWFLGIDDLLNRMGLQEETVS